MAEDRALQGGLDGHTYQGNEDAPKDCYDCKFLLANYDEAECQVTCYFCFLKKGTICEGDDRELAKGIKPSTCPLVALPPHGELISRGGALFQLQAEALGISPNDKDFEGIKKGLLIARKIIIKAPVIVEATE